jgi:chromosome condensin MukBEF ATPase and DNA-binding subunit MukB
MIWNNKRWSLIVVLCILILCQLFQANRLAGDLRKVETTCQDKINKKLKPYLDAEKEAQELANKAGEEYEESKEVERVKTEVITREVQKIVERPVYIHTNCFDKDRKSTRLNSSHVSEPQ